MNDHRCFLQMQYLRQLQVLHLHGVTLVGTDEDLLILICLKAESLLVIVHNDSLNIVPGQSFLLEPGQSQYGIDSYVAPCGNDPVISDHAHSEYQYLGMG